VIKTTDGSVFTGLTSALIDGKRYLYVANTSKGRVDVYDNAFHLVDLECSAGRSNGGLEPLRMVGQPPILFVAIQARI
jgi:hypothetical protein